MNTRVLAYLTEDSPGEDYFRHKPGCISQHAPRGVAHRVPIDCFTLAECRKALASSRRLPRGARGRLRRIRRLAELAVELATGGGEALSASEVQAIVAYALSDARLNLPRPITSPAASAGLIVE